MNLFAAGASRPSYPRTTSSRRSWQRTPAGLGEHNTRHDDDSAARDPQPQPVDPPVGTGGEGVVPAEPPAPEAGKDEPANKRPIIPLTPTREEHASRNISLHEH
eukprot:53605-Heterocapsa_arctica.AAC.1